jgi:hypothetical protein
MRSKLLLWTPRILAILSILFMMMFSFDVFNGNEPLNKKMLAFLIHNIPVLILTLILIITFKWEVIGGILFIISAIAGSLFFHSFSGNPGSLIVLCPWVLVGILFILHDFLYSPKNTE